MYVGIDLQSDVHKDGLTLESVLDAILNAMNSVAAKKLNFFERASRDKLIDKKTLKAARMVYSVSDGLIEGDIGNGMQAWLLLSEVEEAIEEKFPAKLSGEWLALEEEEERVVQHCSVLHGLFGLRDEKPN